MKKQLFLIAMSILSLQTISAQTINAKESKIDFQVDNMGNMVHGTVSNIKGEVKFDENNLDGSTIKATADPKTISTKTKARDKHLQKDDFFGVATFPEMKLESKKITKTATGYEALMVLTIRNISLDITIPFTVKKENDKQVFDANFSLKRKDYKLGEKTDAGMIGLDVMVKIRCVVD